MEAQEEKLPESCGPCEEKLLVKLARTEQKHVKVGSIH